MKSETENKPRITVRVVCPGSKDIAAELYVGSTINLNMSVHNIEEAINYLPRGVYFAFKAMIEDNENNRCEIMQGITSYSCYRRPEAPKPEQGTRLEYWQKEQGLTDEQIRNNINLDIKLKDRGFEGIPPIAPKVDGDINFNNRVPQSCGGHCPHKRQCDQLSYCIAEFPNGRP